MGLEPTHRNERHSLHHPRAGGGARDQNEQDSRWRGNDRILEGAERRISALGKLGDCADSLLCSE